MVAMLVLGCGRDTDSTVSLPPDPSVVSTAQGMVQGVATLDKRHFAGIPYAAPPFGELCMPNSRCCVL